MFKRMIVAFAGVLVVLGLAATPASASTNEAANVTMWADPLRITAPASDDILGGCKEVATKAAGQTIQTRSAHNGSGSKVAFYALPNCAGEIEQVPDGSDTGAAVAVIGALSFQAVS